MQERARACRSVGAASACGSVGAASVDVGEAIVGVGEAIVGALSVGVTSAGASSVRALGSVGAAS